MRRWILLISFSSSDVTRYILVGSEKDMLGWREGPTWTTGSAACRRNCLVASYQVGFCAFCTRLLSLQPLLPNRSSLKELLHFTLNQPGCRSSPPPAHYFFTWLDALRGCNPAQRRPRTSEHKLKGLDRLLGQRPGAGYTSAMYNYKDIL